VGVKALLKILGFLFKIACLGCLLNRAKSEFANAIQLKKPAHACLSTQTQLKTTLSTIDINSMTPCFSPLQFPICFIFLQREAIKLR